MSSSLENSSSSEAHKIETQPATESNPGQANELATAIGGAAGIRHLRNATRQAKAYVGKENCFI